MLWSLYHFASSNATSGPGKLPVPSAERQRNSRESLPRSAQLNLTNGFIRQLTSVRARDTCHAWPRSLMAGAENTPSRRNFGSHVKGRRRPSARRRRASPNRNDAVWNIYDGKFSRVILVAGMALHRAIEGNSSTVLSFKSQITLKEVGKIQKNIFLHFCYQKKFNSFKIDEIQH